MGKILIAYSSRYGSTKEIAEHLGVKLGEEGHIVDVVNASNSPEVDDYSLIIVGSGIQAGAWHKDAKNFLKKNSEKFKSKKIALFVSCGDVLEPEKRDASYKKYLLDQAEAFELKPVAFGFFGGKFDFTGSNNFFYNIFMRLAKSEFEKKGIKTEGIYDFRNWDEIDRWTEELGVEC